MFVGVLYEIRKFDFHISDKDVKNQKIFQATIYFLYKCAQETGKKRLLF